MVRLAKVHACHSGRIDCFPCCLPVEKQHAAGPQQGLGAIICCLIPPQPTHSRLVWLPGSITGAASRDFYSRVRAAVAAGRGAEADGIRSFAQRRAIKVRMSIVLFEQRTSVLVLKFKRRAWHCTN